MSGVFPLEKYEERHLQGILLDFDEDLVAGISKTVATMQKMPNVFPSVWWSIDGTTNVIKLKKNYKTVASSETVRNGTDVLAPYTSLGTVNGFEMLILRDTGSTLDLICKKYVKPSMFINEIVIDSKPLEETLQCVCQWLKLSWTVCFVM
ncbi:SCAN box domain-containing protein [Trichonephila clavipes]|nr:SCAN box domain-containing protein [Trichonephila clavipes]